MYVYSPTYKCQLCGELFQVPKHSTIHEREAIGYAAQRYLEPVVCLHDCKDGSVGKGDFAGMTRRNDGTLPEAQMRFASEDFSKTHKVAFDGMGTARFVEMKDSECNFCSK